MNKTKTIFIGVSLLLTNAMLLKAQQSVVATGGDITGSGGTVNYTIGQANYITASGSGITTITEGVQQPYQIVINTGIQETGINLSCAVSPNPTTDYITLSVTNGVTDNMSYSVFDMMGKLLTTSQIKGNQSTISMVDFADAVYLVRVYNSNKEVKSFKVIKNK
jgi:hypothetical protein